MSENSSIEWTDHTFNPWRGCTMVSPGCAHCYAAREAKRFPGIRGIWGDKGTRIVAVPSAWKEPRKWNRKADFGIDPGPDQALRRPRVFCASLADVFEDWQGELRFPADIAPEGWVTARWDGFQLVREFEDSAAAQGLPPATMDNARTELFRLIEETPNLDWQLVTKRPENVMRMVPEHWREAFPSNVWMGTTCEDQQRADERIPQLLKIPARVRFLSCEPLLSPVNLPLGSHRFCPECRGTFSYGDNGPGIRGNSEFIECDQAPASGIHWVIAGGESGPGARPMHPDWAVSLRDQCQAAGVPFLFKQWGEWHPDCLCPGKGHPDKTIERPAPGSRGVMFHCGKHAGRQLAGREWNEFPA